MKVENSKMVSVNYTLTVDGKIADQSREGSPLQFVWERACCSPSSRAPS